MLFVSIPWETVVFFRQGFQHGVSSYLKTVFRYLVFTLFAGVITYMLCSYIQDGGILIFALKIIICMIVPNLIIVLLGIKDDQHKDTIKFVLSMISRSKANGED